MQTSCAKPAPQNAVQTRLGEREQPDAAPRDAPNGPKTHEVFSRFDILDRCVDEAEAARDAMGLGVVKTLEEEIAEPGAATTRSMPSLPPSGAPERRKTEMEDFMSVGVPVVSIFIGLPWVILLHYITAEAGAADH